MPTKPFEVEVADLAEEISKALIRLETLILALDLRVSALEGRVDGNGEG